jgi:hypothetical protein
MSGQGPPPSRRSAREGGGKLVIIQINVGPTANATGPKICYAMAERSIFICRANLVEEAASYQRLSSGFRVRMLWRLGPSLPSRGGMRRLLR